MVGERPVNRMLIDTGADISLIAEDMLPRATQLGKPVWVEGVGKQSQLYKTAQIPVTIQGVTTEVLMAVAPTKHIPFSVVLGRNVPGMTFSWTLGKNNNRIVTKEGDEAGEASTSRDTQAAREPASQVVEEKAVTLDPAEQTTKVQELHLLGQPQKATMRKEKKLTNGQHTGTGDGSSKIHLSKMLGEEQLAQSPTSPNMEEDINTQSSPISGCPKMDISIEPVHLDLEEIANTVAMAVETRVSKKRRLELTRRQHRCQAHHSGQYGGASGCCGSEGEAEPQEIDVTQQTPLATSPTGTADCSSRPNEATPAPTPVHTNKKQPTNTKQKKKSGKKIDTKAAQQRDMPDMYVSRDKFSSTTAC